MVWVCNCRVDMFCKGYGPIQAFQRFLRKRQTFYTPSKRNILSLVLQNVQASDTFNLLEMQHHRRLTTEKRHQHRYPSLIHINIGDGPCLTCPRAIKDAYTLTYREMTHSLLLCGNFLGLLHY